MECPSLRFASARKMAALTLFALLFGMAAGAQAVSQQPKPGLTLYDVLGASLYPNYEKMDEVLAQLVSLLSQLQKTEPARRFLERLQREHPHSPQLSLGYVALGDSYFANGDYSNALRYYQKALLDRKGPIYGYALYKTGWVYYSLRDFKHALDTFAQMISVAEGR